MDRSDYIVCFFSTVADCTECVKCEKYRLHYSPHTQTRIHLRMYSKVFAWDRTTHSPHSVWHLYREKLIHATIVIIIVYIFHTKIRNTWERYAHLSVYCSRQLLLYSLFAIFFFVVARYDAIDAIILHNKFRFIARQSSWLVYVFTLRCRRWMAANDMNYNFTWLNGMDDDGRCDRGWVSPRFLF